MGFKKILGKVGDIGKKVAPLATFIPGVGPVVAGLAGAGFGAMGQLNNADPSVGGAFKDAAIYGGTGYAGAKVIDKFAPSKWTGAGGAAPTVPGRTPGGGVGDAASHMAAGLAGAGGGGMTTKDWLQLALGGAGAVTGAIGDQQAGARADAAVQEDRRRYDLEAATANQHYADQRGDIAGELERRRRSGVAMNPLVAGLWQGRQS